MHPFDPKLLKLLRSADHIVVLTGAGVSAESGVPTFRDPLTGLWSRFDPGDLETPEAFARHPRLVTHWYDERRVALAECHPNPGHFALARLQEILLSQHRHFTLITQNVDRLHQAAGSKDVLELHGTLWLWRCASCGKEAEERGPAFATYPPLCDACGGHRRPSVVFFGEEVPGKVILQAQRAAGSCRLFMTLGTSGVVFPAAGLVDLALHNHARILEINTQETHHSDRVHWSLRGKTGEILPRLIEEMLKDPADHHGPKSVLW